MEQVLGAAALVQLCRVSLVFWVRNSELVLKQVENHRRLLPPWYRVLRVYNRDGSFCQPWALWPAPNVLCPSALRTPACFQLDPLSRFLLSNQGQGETCLTLAGGLEIVKQKVRSSEDPDLSWAASAGSWVFFHFLWALQLSPNIRGIKQFLGTESYHDTNRFLAESFGNSSCWCF